MDNKGKNMHNDILKIGRVTIHGYGLMIAIGFIVALIVGALRARRRGMNQNHVYNIGIIAIVFGFVGAKLLYCAVAFRSFIADPWLIISGGGFVFYGGVIVGIIAVLIYCKIRKIKFLDYFDLLAPSVSLAQGFGRIGCFLAGCCYGKPTNSIFGVVFPQGAIAPAGVKLIPTELISSAGDFIIALVLLLVARKKRLPGNIGGLYLILYSVGRFLIEFLRGDPRGFIGALSTSQFISIFTLILGILIMIFGARRGHRLALSSGAELSEGAGDGGEPESGKSNSGELNEGNAEDRTPGDGESRGGGAPGAPEEQ